MVLNNDFYEHIFRNVNAFNTIMNLSYKEELLLCLSSFFVQCYKFELIYYDATVYLLGGAHGVMVIIIGNGHGDTSSNPGRDWLHFTWH